MSNVLLDAGNSIGGIFNKGVANGSNGIQNGFVPNYHEWNGSPKFVKPDMIFVMLQEPKAMKYMPNGNERVALLKDFLERQAKNITGINVGVTNEFAETLIGNGGDVHETISNATYERSVPSFVADELEGRLFSSMLTDYSIDLLKDPNTGKPGILRRQAYLDAGRPTLTAEMRSIVGLAFEPNTTMDGVVSAVILYNMQIKGTQVELGKETGGAGAIPEVTAEFTASAQHGYAAFAIAKEYLASLNMAGMAPLELRGAVTGQSTLVASISETRSNQAQLNRAATELPTGDVNATGTAVDTLLDTFISTI